MISIIVGATNEMDASRFRPRVRKCPDVVDTLATCTLICQPFTNVPDVSRAVMAQSLRFLFSPCLTMVTPRVSLAATDLTPYV